MEPEARIELATPALRKQCSTIELLWLPWAWRGLGPKFEPIAPPLVFRPGLWRRLGGETLAAWGQGSRAWRVVCAPQLVPAPHLGGGPIANGGSSAGCAPAWAQKSGASPAVGLAPLCIAGSGAGSVLLAQVAQEAVAVTHQAQGARGGQAQVEGV